MRASIIIAAHQEGALLAKTIESCLRADADLERATVDQQSTVNANGDATIQKNGAGPFGNNAADPSMDLGTAPNPTTCPGNTED